MEIRRQRVKQLRANFEWEWHVDKLFGNINAKKQYLWRAIDQRGEVFCAIVRKRRNNRKAPKFFRNRAKILSKAEEIVTDRFASY